MAGQALAAGGKVTSPSSIAPDRYVYYPGTEVLDKGEVRVIACGTGMPDQRRGAASACFLFEFGSGEKMIFDLGSGSMRNIASLMIPYEYLTKISLAICTRTTGATLLHSGPEAGQLKNRGLWRSGVQAA
jgi:ribonuclease Z